MKARILFVDDDLTLLDGIDRTLIEHDDDWKMEFVTSGEDALKLMGNKEFDIVVSGLILPGISGSELLKKIRALYPGTTLIVLFGHTDDESIGDVMGVIHDIISKSCYDVLLESKIRDALKVRSIVPGGA